MEEQVGQYWDRFISKVADPTRHHPPVLLDDVRKPLAIFFRTLGGDAGLTIKASVPVTLNTRRNLLQRLAGSGKRVALAWRSLDTLYLPQTINLYSDGQLNRDLYYWLAALASAPTFADLHWLQRSQQQVLHVLQQYPGLVARYAALARALMATRPDIHQLPAGEAKLELAIQQAIMQPGQVEMPEHSCAFDPMPVFLWLHPSPPEQVSEVSSSTADTPQTDRLPGESQEAATERKRQAKRKPRTRKEGGLLALRYETSLFSTAEMANLDRAEDEDDDLSRAEENADDLDTLTISRDNEAVAKRIRFDLDLPSQAEDDLVLGDDHHLPEWDYQKQSLLSAHCNVITLKARPTDHGELPFHLHAAARRLRRQFQALRPQSVWVRHQEEGSELDLESYLHFKGQRSAGQQVAEPRLYSSLEKQTRDLACLLLADLSLSTDAWVADQARVIDIIRDSLYLFSEALHQTGDQFSICGFSSRYRNHVRFHELKSFHEPYGYAVRQQIQAIKPGYYTRMGAAVRRATELLLKQPQAQKLLLILTDGKPNDLDYYEGRYGIEDTRMAIIEARKAGLIPFCITIDEEAEAYLPYLFGQGHYTLLRRAAELPVKLPQLYAKLTA